jgi:hypothetical protein
MTTNAEITEQECEPGAADSLHKDKEKKGPFETLDWRSKYSTRINGLVLLVTTLQ